MIHARTDYDPIQDPREGGIGKYEPVFLLRAKDPWFTAMLARYIALNEIAGGQNLVTTSLLLHIARAKEWREKYADLFKVHPDMPLDAKRPILTSDGEGRYKGRIVADETLDDKILGLERELQDELNRKGRLTSVSESELQIVLARDLMNKRDV